MFPLYQRSGWNTGSLTRKLRHSRDFPNTILDRASGRWRLATGGSIGFRDRDASDISSKIGKWS